LISKEEAEEAVGASVQDGQSTAENQVLGLVGSCIYQGTDSSQGATVVNLIVLGTTVPREVFDSEIVNDMADGAPVSGLGEVAYAIAGLATVFDQGLVLTLQILNQLVPADAAVITDLLATALDRADALR